MFLLVVVCFCVCFFFFGGGGASFVLSDDVHYRVVLGVAVLLVLTGLFSSAALATLAMLLLLQLPLHGLATIYSLTSYSYFEFADPSTSAAA